MRLGLFMMPLHPPTRTLGAFLEETAEKALLAERLRFDEGRTGGVRRSVGTDAGECEQNGERRT